MPVSPHRIEIVFARIRREFPDDVYRSFLAKLPAGLQERNQQFVRWQDRQANLMGKILLLSSSVRLGTGANALQDLKYNDFGKPSLDYLNFSISHSGELVICACTTSKMRLGADVEQIKPVEFDDFYDTMTPGQWEHIKQIPAMALQRFYSYWVIKESVIKAEGRGLSVPLTGISISDNTAFVANGEEPWHTAEFAIDPGYAMAIATNLVVCRNNIALREFNPIPV